MNKITEIFSSWVAAADPTPEQQAVAEYRAAVCDSCEKKKYITAINSFRQNCKSGA